MRFRVPPVVITCAIRITWVYLTQHLPPMAFLGLRRFTPAHTCLACFIQAPLMGFKEQRESTSDLLIGLSSNLHER